jgi:hypothetical protein
MEISPLSTDSRPCKIPAVRGIVPPFPPHTGAANDRRWSVSFVQVTLGLAPLLASRGTGPRFVGCPRCGHFLTLHQPVMDEPDRTIGTCDDCEGWFLIGDKAGVMILLPDADELERLGE